MSLQKIRVLAIVGSPRHGNTEFMTREALKAADSVPGVETEMIHLGEMDIHPCQADYRCVTQAREGSYCPVWKDDMEKIYPRILAADGLIIASPVYYANVSAQIKMMMDRMQPLKARGQEWAQSKDTGFHGACRNKVGGALVVARLRNGGQETTIQAIHHFFLFLDMIPVGTGEVTCCGFGAAGSIWLDPDHPRKGAILNGVQTDAFGLQSARALGERVAEVAKLIRQGEQWEKGNRPA